MDVSGGQLVCLSISFKKHHSRTSSEDLLGNHSAKVLFCVFEVRRIRIQG